MIQIRFEGQTMAELIRQTMEFVSESSGRKVGFVDEAPATVEPPKQEPETKPQAPEAKPQAPKVDLADVRKACVAYRDKHGQAALVEVFGKLGAKKLPDVQEEKYAELMELVKV